MSQDLCGCACQFDSLLETETSTKTNRSMKFMANCTQKEDTAKKMEGKLSVDWYLN